LAVLENEISWPYIFRPFGIWPLADCVRLVGDAYELSPGQQQARPKCDHCDHDHVCDWSQLVYTYDCTGGDSATACTTLLPMRRLVFFRLLIKMEP
jgi:hypothetical protein